VELGKRELGFSKDDITRDVDVTRGNVETFESLVKVAITQKGTPGRSILEFMRVVRTKVGPARAPEHTKIRIVWGSTEKAMKWSIVIKNLCKCSINQVSDSEEGLVPIL
jgi:hypothetical protein